FAGKDVQDVEASMDKILLVWLERLTKDWVRGPGLSRGFDIAKRIQFLTVDIITQLSLGECFQCTEHDTDRYGFLETVKDATPISLQMSLFPEIPRMMYHLTKIPLLRRLLVPSENDEGGIGKVIGVSTTSPFLTAFEREINYPQVIKQIIDRRIAAESSCKNNMVGSFLDRGLSRTQAPTELVVAL
ncbi:MAG: hypothetical protein Q9203_005413, partial [Teloschistes exilis]